MKPLKNHTGGKHYRNEDILRFIFNYMSDMDAESFLTEMQQNDYLERRYEKWLDFLADKLMLTPSDHTISTLLTFAYAHPALPDILKPDRNSVYNDNE